MPYGDLPHDTPLKPNKGLEGGACNVTTCQAEPASYYNHGSHAWYCVGCRNQIGGDIVNRTSWMARWYPKLGHMQFETREEIDAREAAKAAEPKSERDYFEEIFVEYNEFIKPTAILEDPSTRPTDAGGGLLDETSMPDRRSPIPAGTLTRQQRRAQERLEKSGYMRIYNAQSQQREAWRKRLYSSK